MFFVFILQNWPFDACISQNTEFFIFRVEELFLLLNHNFCLCGYEPEINTLWSRQNDRHFTDESLFLELEQLWFWISLKYGPIGPIINIPALVQMVAWRRTCDKPLFNDGFIYWRMYAPHGLDKLTTTPVGGWGWGWGGWDRGWGRMGHMDPVLLTKWLQTTKSERKKYVFLFKNAFPFQTSTNIQILRFAFLQTNERAIFAQKLRHKCSECFTWHSN